MKTNTFTILTIAATASMLMFAGCAGDGFAGNTYSRSQVKTTNAVLAATIVQIDAVQIEGTDGSIGAIAGGVLGGVIGNTIGGGSGRKVATAAGAVGGALAGAAVEGSSTKRNALEITVQYDNGAMEAIVQTPDNDVLQVGQRVRILVNQDGTKRVRP